MAVLSSRTVFSINFSKTRVFEKGGWSNLSVHFSRKYLVSPIRALTSHFDILLSTVQKYPELEALQVYIEEKRSEVSAIGISIFFLPFYVDKPSISDAEMQVIQMYDRLFAMTSVPTIERDCRECLGTNTPGCEHCLPCSNGLCNPASFGDGSLLTLTIYIGGSPEDFEVKFFIRDRVIPKYYVPSNDSFTHVYRGIYNVEVSKGGYKAAKFPLNLIDDQGDTIVCKLVLEGAEGDRSICRFE